MIPLTIYGRVVHSTLETKLAVKIGSTVIMGHIDGTLCDEGRSIIQPMM